MPYFEKNSEIRIAAMNSLGRKSLTILWSALLAFVILAIGQGVWSILLVANFRRGPSAPWSIVAMIGFLWLMWQYLSGRWWPRGTSERRRRLFRANHVSSRSFALAFIAGVLAMIALAGYWIVFYQLVRTLPNAMPDLSKYSLLVVSLVLTMSAVVSPVVEEIAFRGYCQKILESQFQGPAAVIISSLLFMLAHTNHGLFWSKLLVYFLAGLAFGTIVYLTDSIIASIPVHIVGDLVFFTLIWPHDASRRLVTEGGADPWFWAHIVQAAIFTALTLLAFRSLARHSASERQSSPAAA
jgi:membrane protease YdiL (CAAX protease family)